MQVTVTLVLFSESSDRSTPATLAFYILVFYTKAAVKSLEPCNSLKKCLVIRCDNALATTYSTEAAITGLGALPNREIKTLLFHVII